MTAVDRFLTWHWHTHRDAHRDAHPHQGLADARAGAPEDVAS
ncbi:MAG: hypothetical protein R2731_03870 [Nocardioides sp.]